MSRNRKTQSAGVRFGPALKAVMLCLLIGGSGVGYVWQKEQIDKLGHQIQTKETVLKRLEKINAGLRRQLDATRSPEFLLRRIKEGELGLVRPPLDAMIRLPEPSPVPPKPQPSTETQFASRTDTAPGSR
ncbi:MAG TPA: hypothetical protein VKY92_02670 [Verrucomicrobiae bacterium]|nr:hypothetical protein [Verrucomicrobiae bacterium]